MITSNVKIGLLVTGHVVAVPLLAWDADITPAGIPFQQMGLFSLTLADAGLLGIWGGLGTTRSKWRLPVVLAAAICLCATLVSASLFGQSSSMYLIVPLATVIILAVLSGLRYGRRKLRLVRLAAKSPTHEGSQFTIRHLLLATAVVAVVLAIGRGARTISDIKLAETLAVAIFTPCFSMVELAILWATLGIGGPTLRLVIVLPTAFIVGTIPVYYLGSPVGWIRFVAWSAVGGLQATITAASLLVVRSCGWRLVRGATKETRPASP